MRKLINDRIQNSNADDEIKSPSLVDISLATLFNISFDEIDWELRKSSVANQWTDIAYGNGIYVAVSNDGTGDRVMTSPDGRYWTTRVSAADNQWNGIIFGNGLFVAVASSGTGNRVMTSPDGITWTSQTSAADNAWQAVTYGNGLFVAVANSGANRVMTSPDGQTWTTRSIASNNWKDVTYGNNLFVTVSETGTGDRAAYSSDGISWNTATGVVDNNWNAVTFGKNLFVATAYTGTGNRAMTSPDGQTWTIRTTPEDNQWIGVTFGKGLFVSVANTGTNRIMTSPDGETWTVKAAPENDGWSDVVYGDNLFVAVAITGSENRVMISKENSYEIDCIGVGNTDATTVTIDGEVVFLDSEPNKTGLYLLTTTIFSNEITIEHNGSYIGRLAVGKARFLGAAPSREPGFYTTSVPRITASGQVVESAGGIGGRRIGLDFRYKIDEDIFQDFEDAYTNQISKGFPFFIYFDKETHRMPWRRLYASTNNELLFQSAVNRFLYSRRFDYRERF